MRRATLNVVFVLSLGASTAAAVYRPMDIQQVPLARVAQNLRRAMLDEPQNPQWVHNLARTYAMAWTLRDTMVPVNAGPRQTSERRPIAGEAVGEGTQPRRAEQLARGAVELWFGYEPRNVPFAASAAATDTARVGRSRAYLDSALALYQRARELDETNQFVQIGYAWLLVQNGERAAARDSLRAIVGNASQLTRGTSGERITFGRAQSLEAEAATYLIPLLSPRADRAEIASLNRLIEDDNNRPRAVTPIAIPLRDGLTASDLEQRSARVRFDADGSGVPARWSWIAPDAAWLVHDPARTGRVASALQLFGGVTFWMFWNSGYDALASLDDNHDGQLTDGELATLSLWRDANGNGVSERGEVRPVSQYAIRALDVRYRRDDQHPDRIAYAPAGVTFADGRTRPTYDLVLHRRESIVTSLRLR
ncbi:MAG: hypothetical protein IT353_21975 [Gemmatimonadaceae bacterium]|nr:hypothetical protein [Gemmatimonadaceae bacterium]